LWLLVVIPKSMATMMTMIMDMTMEAEK